MSSAKFFGSLLMMSLLGCPAPGGTTSASGSSGGGTTGESTQGGGSTTEGGTTAPTTGGSTTTTTGATSSGTTDEPTSGGVTGPGPEDPALGCASEPCFNVINRCEFPIWVHAQNNDGIVLMPDMVQLAPAGFQQYPVPAEWPAGRVNAYFKDPAQFPTAFDKVEMTVTGGIMNYNITYVDYVALPAEMRAVGPECQPNADFDPAVGCYVERAAVLDGCPDDLLDDERCLSASLYCADAAHVGEPYCHALDDRIAECVAAHPETCGVAGLLGDGTPQVYGCSGYFDSQPPNCMPASETCHFEGNKWCAALNRGMLGAPDDPDPNNYYKQAPYNTYAKWVHDTCPGIYAFAYDDYPPNAGESGFRACKAPRLDIVFCPVG